LKILIADDDDFSRTLLAGVLESLSHEVTAVPDGQTAWDAVSRDYFPVLITDWMMPGISGPDLCRQIRRAQRENYTYIIVLTARAGKESYLEGMRAGADDFITKPFDEDQLAARLAVAERILGLRRHVSRLEGLLPICAYCKKIRDDRKQWQQIEKYVAERSETLFSHGICPECLKREFPEVAEKLEREGGQG
jgi:DNA-binding response OmpR family regulator